MKTLKLHQTPDGWLHLRPTENSKPYNIEYDPDAPCICCGEPVVDASMGGTAVCPWCDCGRNRTGGEMIYLGYGPRKPHPKYLEHYKISLEEYLEKKQEIENV